MPGAVIYVLYNVNRDENPKSGNEMDSPSLKGFTLS